MGVKPWPADSAIVAEVGEQTSEPMEPRAEPKGNLEGQSTRRTQDRESVHGRGTAVCGGASHDAPSPCHCRSASLGVLRAKEERCGSDGMRGGCTRKGWKAGWTCTTACIGIHAIATGKHPEARGSASRPLRTRSSRGRGILRGGVPGVQHGFRPGRGAHNALDALAVGIERRKIWIADADVRGFFDSVSGWPVPRTSHRSRVKADHQVVERRPESGGTCGALPR